MSENKSPVERLRMALAKHEERHAQAQENAPALEIQLQELEPLYSQLEQLTQPERRRVLNEAGLRRISAAPAPITPLRGGRMFSSSAPKMVPRFLTPEEGVRYEQRVLEAADAMLAAQDDFTAPELVTEPQKDTPESATLPEPVVWNCYVHQPGPELTDDEVEAARVEVEAIQAAEARSQAHEQEAERERMQRNWWGVSSSYIVSVMLQHQCATAKDLFNKLHQLAGDDSPFERGQAANRGSLFVKDLAKNLSLKTVQNNWGKIKAAAFG